MAKVEIDIEILESLLITIKGLYQTVDNDHGGGRSGDTLEELGVFPLSYYKAKDILIDLPNG